MLKMIHPVAGAIASLTILIFWLSTLFAELFGSEACVVGVKTAIPWGFLLLVPAMMTAGGTGLVLSKRSRFDVVDAKLKRMPFIAANGLLILIPAALFLASKARRRIRYGVLRRADSRAFSRGNKPHVAWPQYARWLAFNGAFASCVRVVVSGQLHSSPADFLRMKGTEQ